MFSLLVTAQILLTKFGSLTTGRNTGYFLHSQNYLQSSDMIVGEIPSRRKSQYKYERNWAPTACLYLPSHAQQYQQDEASPVL